VGLKPGPAEEVESFLVGMAESGEIPCHVQEEEDGSRCLLMPLGRDEGLEIRREGDHLVAFARTGDFDGPSLVASPRFQEARRLHQEDGAVLFGYIDFARSAREGMALLRLVPDDEGRKIADLLEGMLDEMGVMDVGPLSLSSGWHEDGLGYTRAVLPFGEGGPRGVMAAALDRHADISLLDYVPANATSFSVMASEPELGWKMVTSIVDRIAAMEADGHPGQTIGELWAASGHPSYDWLLGDKREALARGFLGFGTQGFSYGTASGGGGYFQRLRDADAVRDLLHELMPMAAEALAGMEEVPLRLSVKRAKIYETGPDGKRTSREGPEYYVLSIVASRLPQQFRPLAMFTAQFSPSIGITADGWLVMCLNSANIRGYLRSGISKPEENIRTNAEVAAFLERLPEGVNMLSWSDPRPGITQAWAMMQGFLPMMSMQAEGLPIDLSAIPSAEALTSALRPSESWSYANREMSVSMSTGSFQFADVFTLTAAVATVVPPLVLGQRLSQAEAEMEAAPPQPEAGASGVSDEQRDEVLEELDRLRSGVVVFQIEKGHLPPSLADLVQATDQYPQGYLPAATDGSHSLRPDPWGNAYVYKVTGEQYQLYSMGPDGEDDGGADDDIGLEG